MNYNRQCGRTFVVLNRYMVDVLVNTSRSEDVTSIEGFTLYWSFPDLGELDSSSSQYSIGIPLYRPEINYLTGALTHAISLVNL
jgi:hypothetical protein